MTSKNKGHMDSCADLDTKCRICNESFPTTRKLAFHIKKHATTMQDYVVKYYFAGKRPVCPICGKETRYTKQHCFKRYCKEHANEARKQWSKENMAFDPGWKKGITKEQHKGIASQAKKVAGKGNPMYGKTHSKETLRLAAKKRREKLLLTKKEFNERVTEIQQRKSLRVTSSYKTFKKRGGVKAALRILCLKCKKRSEKSLWSMSYDWAVCSHCNPQGSRSEQEVAEFVATVTDSKILRNDRQQISPLELDIFLPTEKLAIEYNGLYWHSEAYKTSDHLLKKIELCKKSEIQLIHVFSDEWYLKKDIVKSMIRNKLHKNTHKVSARKGEVRELTKKEAKDFFEKTHISGYTACKVAFGIIVAGSIVSALSLRSPIQKTYKGYLELARVSSALNTTVNGSLGKLLKVAKLYTKEAGYDGIMTYADRRFGEGQVYANNGFKFIKKTALDYWYTDNDVRYNRFKFRAQKGKTERQMAEANKVVRVYGCGNNLYMFEF